MLATKTMKKAKKKVADDGTSEFEELYDSRFRRREVPKSREVLTSSMDGADAKQLIQELEVHQIELERQNQALRETRLELEESLNNYTDLFDMGPIGYGSLSDRGSMLAINLAGAALLGRPREELIDKRFVLFVAPQDRPSFNAFIDRLFGTGGPQRCQIFLASPEHPPRRLQLEATLSAASPHRRCLIAMLDITDRELCFQERTASLQENAVHFRTLIGSRQVIRLLIEPGTGRILEATPAAAVYYGYSQEQLSQMYLWEIRVLSREECLDRLSLVANSRTVPPPFFGRHRLGHGEEREVVAYWELLRCKGTDLILATVFDVTQAKWDQETLARSEARLQRVLAGAEQSYWELNCATNQIWTSPLGAPLFGRPADEESVGFQRRLQLVHPEDGPGLIAALAARCAGDVRPTSFEYRIRTEDGTWRWIHSRGWVAEYDSHGRPLLLAGTDCDITERKASEESLRLQAEQFRGLLENLPVCVWELDCQGCFTFLSPQFQTLTGYPPADFLGRRPEELAQTEVREEVSKRKRIILSNHQVFSGLQFPIRHADGRSIVTGLSGAPFVGPQGECQGMRGIAADITERLQREAEQVEAQTAAACYPSEIRLGALIDQNLAGVVEIDHQTRITQVNSQCCTLLGRTREELLGKEWVDLILPGDDTDDLHWLDDLIKLGQACKVEVRCQRQSGEWVWLHLAAEPIVDPVVGQRLGALILMLDISERKQAETLLHQSEAAARRRQAEIEAYYDSAPVGLCALDCDLRLLRINDRLNEMYGSSSTANLGRTFREVFPEFADQAEPLMRQVLAKGKSVRNFESASQTPAQPGITRIWQMHFFPINSLYGQVIGISIVIEDITEHQLADRLVRDSEQRYRELSADLERQVLARTAEANAANAAKSRFLADMSHEIRTPLHAVMGLAQLLKRESLGDGQHRMVQRIEDAGENLLGIIDDILDLSKIEAGRLRIEPAKIFLADHLAEIEDLMRITAQDKGLTLRVVLPTEPLGILVGDGLRLKQVLINLLGNAIKFTHQGEVCLLVEPLRVTKTTIRLVFKVRDTGIGIDPGVLKQLFDPFTQATGCQSAGTGLGLAISKHLVELMGGTIGVVSQPGQGSTFWFELPFSRTAPDELAQGSLGEPESPADSCLAGRHILVVDDSDINRELVGQALRLAGAQVLLAVNGYEALEILQREPEVFDAVLMDVRMPVMDGLNATRLIRRKLALTAIPIIALTAGVMPWQQEEVRRAGYNDILTKPFKLDTMVALLWHWLKSRPPASCASPLPPCQPETAMPQALDCAMEEGFPVITGIDGEQVAEILCGNRTMFLKLLGQFVNRYGSLVSDVRADLEQGEQDSAARRLHNLRGNAGSLGALELAAKAKILEEAIDRGGTELEAGLADLEDQLAALISAMAPWQAQTFPEGGAAL